MPLLGLCYEDIHVALKHSSLMKNERNQKWPKEFNQQSSQALSDHCTHSSSGQSPSEPHSEGQSLSAGFHPDLQPCAVGESHVCCFTEMKRQLLGECGA